MDPIEILRRLVSFDTTSHRSNVELVNWVAGLLSSYGARIRLTHDEAGQKANILAGFGPDTAGGVLLSGHTDVVPADGRSWSADPFVLRERAGRLYGRGTADMKGFLAACLSICPEWRNAPLARPILLALTYDEETGARGAPGLLDDLLRHVPLPALAIVGEPTGMRVADRHPGYLVFRSTFHGRTAHSSDPAKGVSAITAAARFVTRIEIGGAGRATVNVGAIRGGAHGNASVGAGRGSGGGAGGGGTAADAAINAVPARCEVIWEARPAPEADLGAIRAAVKRQADAVIRPGLTIDTSEIISVPPLRPQPDNPAVRVARELGAEPLPAGLPFGSEAGLFQAAGIPTAMCGPGAIDQAHKADEWIAIEQLDAATRFLSRLTAWAVRPSA